MYTSVCVVPVFTVKLPYIDYANLRNIVKIRYIQVLIYQPRLRKNIVINLWHIIIMTCILTFMTCILWSFTVKQLLLYSLLQSSFTVLLHSQLNQAAQQM